MNFVARFAVRGTSVKTTATAMPEKKFIRVILNPPPHSGKHLDRRRLASETEA
jgi:hypothetical protein